MSDKTENKGLGLGTILFLIFLTLKLGGWGIVATWSWWWVFSPIWLPIGFILIVFMIVGLITYLNR